ncbi:MAG: PAS domain S-box protein, partial [Spirochaetes bacterium]|nr:PAS domain S-box protein [Spirochaetota bacterium]
ALERLKDNLARAFKGDFVSSEWEPVLEDNRPVAFHFNYVPVQNRDGAVDTVIVSTYDMTAVRKMRDQNRELAVAIEQSPTSVLITDADGTIVYVNAYTEQITGYSREELIGRNPRILQSGFTDPSVYEEMWTTISGGDTWHGEMINRRKDGSLLTERMVVAPVVNEAGNVVRYIGLKADITEERRTQRALRDSEELYRTLFDSAPVGIVICNAEGVVQETNEALGAIFGIPELASATDFRASAFAPFVDSRLTDALQQAVEQDRTLYREEQYVLTDKHTVTLRFIVTPIYAEDETVQGAQAFVEDFTWLHAARGQIERSLSEKESLLREIHHRVKNNLQTLASLLRLQSDATQDSPAKRALLDSVARVQTMAMVHERLYASESLARISFHEYLNDLVGHLVSLGFAAPKRVALDLDLDPVKLDIDLAIPIGLIANEFVTNALKHGVSQAESPELSVSAKRQDANLVLTVQDNGPGFSGDLGDGPGGTLGMDLIRALAGQLKAQVSYNSTRGLQAKLTVPLNESGGGEAHGSDAT